MLDLLIQNGLIADGTGGKPFYGDIAVESGRIVRIAPKILLEAKTVYDAAGKVVSPGFIDNHSHGDYYCLFGTTGYNLLEQGITTEIAGNCGGGAIPYYEGLLDSVRGIVPDEAIEMVKHATGSFSAFSAATQELRMGTNMAVYAPHGNLRALVMGYSPEKPSPEQMERMKALLTEAMESGFVGLSTGLIYPPSVYADAEELTELCRVVAAYRGCYASHIRGECDTVVQAVAEAIAIGENSGCDVVISHHKIGGTANAGLSKETLRLIAEANERGMIRVRADQYPFLAGQTSLTSALPERFAVHGVAKMIERLREPAFRQEVSTAIFAEESQSLLKFSGFAGCLILGAPKTPNAVGKTIAQIAKERASDAMETTFDLLTENSGDVDAAYFYQNEQDMLRILAAPFTMGGTDSGHNIMQFDREQQGGAHPRAMSTFPKRLRLVREQNILPLEEEIKRICYLPAEMCKLDNVGLLREGYHADICVFDWANIRENNDYHFPFRKNTGIELVVVNGEIAVLNGDYTGVKAGRMIRRRNPHA